MTNKPITCKDCKWYSGWRMRKECTHPESTTKDFVTGKKEYTFIRLFRKFICGKDNPQYFEPKLTYRLDKKLGLRK